MLSCFLRYSPLFMVSLITKAISRVYIYEEILPCEFTYVFQGLNQNTKFELSWLVGKPADLKQVTSIACLASWIVTPSFSGSKPLTSPLINRQKET